MTYLTRDLFCTTARCCMEQIEHLDHFMDQRLKVSMAGAFGQSVPAIEPTCRGMGPHVPQSLRDARRALEHQHESGLFSAPCLPTSLCVVFKHAFVCGSEAGYCLVCPPQPQPPEDKKSFCTEKRPQIFRLCSTLCIPRMKNFLVWVARAGLGQTTMGGSVTKQYPDVLIFLSGGIPCIRCAQSRPFWTRFPR